MTILSKNNNPKNESKYARHRSTWKGTLAQLTYLVEGLRAQGRKIFCEVQSDWEGIMAALGEQLGFEVTQFRVSRRGARGREVLGQWVLRGKCQPPERWLRLVAEDLKGDLKLIWDDFQMTAGLRAPDQNTGTYAEYLLVAAISRDKIDIVFSKYGYRRNHHFFHWQAVSEGTDGVHVDDSPVHFFHDLQGLGDNLEQGFTLNVT